MRPPNPARTAWVPARSTFGLTILLCLAAFVGGPGCAGPRPKPSALSFAETDDILDRCVAAYSRAATLRARGLLSDFRHGTRRVVPIAWDFVRPDRCRLQIDMDVAIFHGANCWTYRSATGRYLGSRAVSQTPIEIGAQLLSEGVPFLLPAIWERGGAAFGKDRFGSYVGWKLQGVAWSDERPCYVFIKKIASPDRENLLRLWIDQDLFLLRGWQIFDPTEDGREKIVMECTYHDLVINGRLPSDAFQLKPPEAIDRPDKSATTGDSAERTQISP